MSESYRKEPYIELEGSLNTGNKKKKPKSKKVNSGTIQDNSESINYISPDRLKQKIHEKMVEVKNNSTFQFSNR